MKTVYSKDNCPGCEQLKAQLKAAGEPFKEVMLGRDMNLSEFIEKFPSVRTVPHVVEDGP